MIMMKHNRKSTLDKVSGTPENAFIWVDSVEGVSVPKKLNKQWYIDLAKKRINDFGVNV